jgi:hypothetical protein
VIILIILGLIQALILPGLICSYYLKDIRPIDRIIFASTTSLIINYGVVWLLYILNIYSQTSVLVLMLVELFILFRLRTLFFKDVADAYQSAGDFITRCRDTKGVSFYFVLFVLFCAYYFHLLKANGFLTVFTHWDAVVSWNRWAVELYDGTFQGSRGYPLAVPILWSIVYVVADETNLQAFAKYICVYWPFLGGLALFASGRYALKFKNALALSSIFYLYLLSKGSHTVDFVFSGLVDPFMAAFGALFVYFALFISSRSNNQYAGYKTAVTFVLLSLVGAALVKLTGVILLFDFVCLIGFLVIYKENLQHHRLHLFWLCIAVLFLAIHWYVITTFYWRDWQPISEYDSLQDSRGWLRPFLHLSLFGQTFGWGFVGLATMGVFSSRRALALLSLVIVPLFIFCAVTVGYDLRATFIVFAPVSVLAAVGIFYGFNVVAKVCGQISAPFVHKANSRLYAAVLLAVVVILVIAGGLMHVFSRDKILSSNTEKRVAANDFGNAGNKRLLQIFEAEPDARIISCWQTPVGLPGAKGRFIPSGNCTVTLLDGWLTDPKIKYWLYRDEGNPSQLLTPEVVGQVLAKQQVRIRAEPLGSGFILYSKW